LIYKHEYDRLRTVLEVLEVFGSPPPPPKDPPTVFDVGQKKKDIDTDTDGGGANNKRKEDDVIKNSGEVIDEPPAQNGKQESLKVRKEKVFANVGRAKSNR